ENHWLPALLQRHFVTQGRHCTLGSVGALINKWSHLSQVLSISAELASHLKQERVASKLPFSSNVL
ncbi:hypothetical protein ACHWGJ_29035, partial [Klebsiella pneumoniae]|uniref:hypothetical protein n=1 Tax=Klebsiella pneumoniae TaxID=573 RepID=UPI00376EADD4